MPDSDLFIDPSSEAGDLVVYAPSKLNLFLHVIGRRQDGYHILQTAFQLLEYHDELHFSPRPDDHITLRCIRACPPALIDDAALEALNSPDNLIYKAARSMQARFAILRGADIVLHKRIPIGGGLGGGSSDAAATLLALRRLWSIDISIDALVPLAQQLGADVPVLLHGRAAWGEGIGNELTFVDLPRLWYLVVFPAVMVPTGPIFQDSRLRRDTRPITVDGFLKGEAATRNDLEPVVAARHPSVAEAIEWLGGFSEARMSGAGSCVFASFGSEEAAGAVLEQVPPQWGAFVSWATSDWQHFAT